MIIQQKRKPFLTYPFNENTFSHVLSNAFGVWVEPSAPNPYRLWEFGLAYGIWFEVQTRSGWELSEAEAAGELERALEFAGQDGQFVAIAALAAAIPYALILGRATADGVELILDDPDYEYFIQFTTVAELVRVLLVCGYAIQYDPKTRRPKLYSREQLAHVFLDTNQPRAAII
jgi:hypothetical protein